jgi:mutator protein MutT
VATPIAIAVVEHNDCVLIGQRPPGVVLEGFWEFPGGKVHDSEDPAACAARECREESGIEVEAVRLLTQSDYEYDHSRLHLQFFYCRPLDPSQQPRLPFRWVERHKLDRYTFPPANEELLRLLETQAQR